MVSSASEANTLQMWLHVAARKVPVAHASDTST